MSSIKVSLATDKKRSSVLEIDKSVAFDLLSAALLLNTGPAGYPAAAGALANIIRGVKVKRDSNQRLLAEAFSLYMFSLVEASSILLSELAVDMPISDGVRKELANIAIESFAIEGVAISPKAFDRPALNPGFVRYKEKLGSLLKRVNEEKISGDRSDTVIRKLGGEFKARVDEHLKNVEQVDQLRSFVDFLNAQKAISYDKRGFWLDYRAHLNELVFRHLFLHEIEGHPDATLKELYVSSRAIFFERTDANGEGLGDELAEGAASSKIHAFDLATHLKNEWLTRPALNCGSSRLITGDPGTGKSTFSLMFAHELIESGYKVLYIPANSIRSFGSSLEDIITKHLSYALSIDQPPVLEVEIADPDASGTPFLIIIDGLDEYDVGDTTVALAAARLVEHAQRSVDDWQLHNRDVRLLLCGRPESASALTAQFRKKFHHLQVTGFVYRPGIETTPADESRP